MIRRTCAFLLLVVALPIVAVAQSPTPESANLSSKNYKNPYYSIGMVLPKATKTSQFQLDASPRGVHALLALKFENVVDFGQLIMISTDSTSGREIDAHKAATAQAEECKKQGMSWRNGPYELINTGHRGTPPSVHTFVLEEFNTPTGEMVMYAFFNWKGDLFTVIGRASTKRSAGIGNDPWWVMPEFFTYAPEKGLEINYHGAAASSAPGLAASPAQLSVPLPTDGKLNGAIYSSAALALRYGIPKGWKPVEGQDLFAQLHPQPSDAAARASHDLLKSCSAPILQLSDPSSADAPNLSLLVADSACLHLPALDMNDMDQVQSVASTLAQFSDFGQVSGAGILSDSGSSFIELKGTLAGNRQQVVFVTSRGPRLLMFFFTAKDMGLIDILPNSGMTFDPIKN